MIFITAGVAAMPTTSGHLVLRLIWGADIFLDHKLSDQQLLDREVEMDVCALSPPLASFTIFVGLAERWFCRTLFGAYVVLCWAN
jgi:hypothetical protein